MEYREYKKLYAGLYDGADLHALSKKYGLSKRALEMILLQKTVRTTMHTHGKVKAKAKKLLSQWSHGKSFAELARENKFPPVMMASILLQETGYSKKQFAQSLRNLSLVKDKRVRGELSAVLELDDIYSPRGAESMSARGRRVEHKVGEWLSAHGVTSDTEKDSQALGRPKTPDFLLHSPFDIGGFKVHWFECKASFGDKYEFRRDYKKQLRHYVDLFGQGLVIYWYGFLSDIESPDVVLTSRVFF